MCSSIDYKYLSIGSALLIQDNIVIVPFKNIYIYHLCAWLRSYIFLFRLFDKRSSKIWYIDYSKVSTYFESKRDFDIKHSKYFKYYITDEENLKNFTIKYFKRKKIVVKDLCKYQWLEIKKLINWYFYWINIKVISIMNIKVAHIAHRSKY